MPNNTKIEKFLEDIQFQSQEQFTILKSIRAIFNNENPQLEEEIKYGGLVFNLSNTLIAGIFVYSRHISIEFSFGAELVDPNKILEGKGKKRRHIKIMTPRDIDEKQVAFFVLNAVREQGK